jgi:hypothetical protein
VLNAENGVSRVYWYSWDLLRMSNTPLVMDDRITLTPAGNAFSTTRNWLLGTRPAGCTRAKTGTWTCAFTTAKQVRRIVWNPSRSASVTVHAGATFGSVSNSANVAKSQRAGSHVTVGVVPVMITTRR